MATESVKLSVCVTCQGAGGRVGEQFFHTLEDAMRERNTATLHPVECMSVCKRPCTVAVSSANKWTYIIGDLETSSDVSALLDYIDIYAASEFGTPPLKERPHAIRKGTIARLAPRCHS